MPRHFISRPRASGSPWPVPIFCRRESPNLQRSESCVFHFLATCSTRSNEGIGFGEAGRAFERVPICACYARRVGSRAIVVWHGLRNRLKWPMANRFLYFAYGSNMLTQRLRARAPSARVEGTGFLEGRRLTFDKVSKDQSGKCDAEATGNPSDYVCGVLFNIDRAEEKALGEAEGLHKGYRKDTIDVVTTDGKRTAVVYIATEKAPSLRPYDWYKGFVIKGAIEH